MIKYEKSIFNYYYTRGARYNWSITPYKIGNKIERYVVQRADAIETKDFKTLKEAKTYIKEQENKT